MRVVSTRPEAPPEGQLITAALKRAKMSVRGAAREAGISEARWRQIASGYQTVSGTHVPVTAPAETLARMARVVRVTAEELREAGRSDAAEELERLTAEPADEGDELLTPAERRMLEEIRRNPRKRRFLLDAILAGHGHEPDSDGSDTDKDAGREAS